MGIFCSRTLLAVSVLLVGGCATTTNDAGRTRFVAPRQLAEVYSEAELRTMLAMTPDAECLAQACRSAIDFRRQVHRLGARLNAAAREIKAELGGEVPAFSFQVPDKAEIGTLSSASGNIVVFSGVRRLDVDEPALAFLIAREMGHVLSRHHEENSAINISVSVAAALVMPMAAVLRGAAATISLLSETSAVAAVATSAASVAGASAIKAIYRPEQLREADLAALRIVNRAGWSMAEVAQSLQRVDNKLDGDDWTGELLASSVWLAGFSGITGWPESAPESVALLASEPAGAGSIEPPLVLRPVTMLSRDFAGTRPETP